MARLPLLNLSSIEIGGGGGLLYDWWNEINESVSWQDGIFYALCAAYALVSSVALVTLPYPTLISLSLYIYIYLFIYTYMSIFSVSLDSIDASYLYTVFSSV